MSQTDGNKFTGSKRTNLPSTTTRTRPHSVHHTARVLVFEDTEHEQNQGQHKKGLQASGSGSSSITVPYRESSAPIPFRKTSYQPNYLRPTMGGGGQSNDMTNLVRVRKSVLGKSAPSLSAGMVSLLYYLQTIYRKYKILFKLNYLSMTLTLHQSFNAVIIKFLIFLKILIFNSLDHVVVYI